MKKPFVFVALGDSAIEGIGSSTPKNSMSHLVYSKIKRKIKNAVFHNFGIGGARILDLHKKLDLVISLSPHLILLSVGANDIIRFTHSKDFKRNYHNLIKRLSEETNARLIINTIPDLTLLPRFPGVLKPYLKQKILQSNRVIRKYARSTKDVLIDLYKESKSLQKVKGIIAKDGLHPSDIGHSIWAELVYAKLEE